MGLSRSVRGPETVHERKPQSAGGGASTYNDASADKYFALKNVVLFDTRLQRRASGLSGRADIGFCFCSSGIRLSDRAMCLCALIIFYVFDLRSRRGGGGMLSAEDV